ncbi:MAG TPA: hypothetical protein VEL51_19105, partial [Vicinamibacterales bacterium]|nr:hypothetical protein [Vicinamibacterales bacterium]
LIEEAVVDAYTEAEQVVGFHATIEQHLALPFETVVLRAISTRAAISRTSFSNHYEYGDLKANPRDLLVKYFDASLYFANWLFLEVAFRYPKGAVDTKALRRYPAGHTVDIRSTARDVIVAISLESDGESFDTADDGSSWLSSLIALRADIASGDERALYLAWLLDLQCGEIDDDALEPGRPDGLGRLSPTLDSFVDIMGIDRGLIAAAAEGASRASAAPSTRQVERWTAALDTDEHVALLARVARGDGSVGAEIMRRSRRHAPQQLSGPLRTAGALRARAESLAEARGQAAQQREVRERARREREQQVARDRYLTGLAKRERQAWQRIDALVGTKRPADYAAAVKLVGDLRDVSGRTGRGAAFGRRIAALRQAHAKNPNLLARLRKVGL